MKSYELRLADGARVVWTGHDGEDASRRYRMTNPIALVLAWRACPPAGYPTHKETS